VALLLRYGLRLGGGDGSQGEAALAGRFVEHQPEALAVLVRECQADLDPVGAWSVTLDGVDRVRGG
jgi:hypothetical protein